MENNTNICIR